MEFTLKFKTVEQILKKFFLSLFSPFLYLTPFLLPSFSLFNTTHTQKLKQLNKS